jgi:hypothetical protein
MTREEAIAADQRAKRLDQTREALRVQLNMLGAPAVAVRCIEALIDAKLASRSSPPPPVAEQAAVTGASGGAGTQHTCIIAAPAGGTPAPCVACQEYFQRTGGPFWSPKFVPVAEQDTGKGEALQHTCVLASGIQATLPGCAACQAEFAAGKHWTQQPNAAATERPDGAEPSDAWLLEQFGGYLNQPLTLNRIRVIAEQCARWERERASKAERAAGGLTGEGRMALWDAVREYVEACGGDTTSAMSDGARRVRRMRAVVSVESAIDKLNARAGLEAAEDPAPQPPAPAEVSERWRGTPPVDMVLHCPACGKQHLDIGEFRTRVHRKHLCENTPEGAGTGCGYLWVPFKYATRGVLGVEWPEDT